MKETSPMGEKLPPLSENATRRHHHHELCLFAKLRDWLPSELVAVSALGDDGFSTAEIALLLDMDVIDVDEMSMAIVDRFGYKERAP
jgi:hypothetical protein